MEIQKRFIQAILLTIASYDSKTMTAVSGLLFEDITLGLKRKLQKIQKELLEAHAELSKDSDDVKKKFEGKDNSEESVKEELKILLEEKIKLNSEPALLIEIEKINTKHNYDFELIEMIAK